MNLKPGQYHGTDLPEGQRAKTIVECFNFLNRPGARDALVLARRADQTGDYRGGMAVLEMVRGGDTGRNIEKDNALAEKIEAERRRVCYGE